MRWRPNLITAYWRRRQRKIDIEILWPECKKMTHNLDSARMVFIGHTMMDPAWSDLSYAEAIAIVNSLT